MTRTCLGSHAAGHTAGPAEGGHATCSEVSLTYFAYPDHVKQVAMTPEIAPDGPIYDAEDFRREVKMQRHAG